MKKIQTQRSYFGNMHSMTLHVFITAALSKAYYVHNTNQNISLQLQLSSRPEGTLIYLHLLTSH